MDHDAFSNVNFTTASPIIGNTESNNRNTVYNDQDGMFIFGDVYLMGYVPPWVSIVYIIVNILIFIGGVAGNILIIIIYFRTKPKTACDWFIFFIAVMDLIVCACYPCLNLRLELDLQIFWDIQGFTCALESLINFSAMLSSCFLLGLMALERYIKVCRPTVASLTGDTAKMVSYGAIALSVLVCLYPSYFHIMASKCAILMTIGGVQMAYMMGLFCIFCVCFILVTVSYANVIRTIELKIKVKQRLFTHNGLHDEGKLKGKNKKEANDDDVDDNDDDNDDTEGKDVSTSSKFCNSGEEKQGRKVPNNIRIEIDEAVNNTLSNNKTKTFDKDQAIDYIEKNESSTKLENKIELLDADQKREEEVENLDKKQSGDPPSLGRNVPGIGDGHSDVNQTMVVDKLCKIATTSISSQPKEVLSSQMTTLCTHHVSVLGANQGITSESGMDILDISSPSDTEIICKEGHTNILTSELSNMKCNIEANCNGEISKQALSLNTKEDQKLCLDISHTNSSNDVADINNSTNLQNHKGKYTSSPLHNETILEDDSGIIQNEIIISENDKNEGSAIKINDNNMTETGQDALLLRASDCRKGNDFPKNKKMLHLKLKPQRSEESCYMEEDLYSDVQPVSFFLRRAKEKMNNLQDRLVKKKLHCSSSCHRRKKWMKERRMTLMLFSITFIFLFSWIPPWSLYLCFLSDHQPFESHMAIRLAYRYWEKMTLLQYCTNFIIYYTFNRGFRKKAKKLMECVYGRTWCRCRKSESVDLEHAQNV